MTACEFSDWFSDSKVPKLNHTVSTRCKESIIRIGVPKGTLEELNSVSMLEVCVLHNSEWLVDVGIVDYQLFVGAS